RGRRAAGGATRAGLRAPLQDPAGRRAEAQAHLSRLGAEWSRREVLDLPRIQAQLPADAALVAWVDVRAAAQAADANGEHWACLVKGSGPPVWVKLPGSGARGAWTADDDTLPARARAALSEPGSAPAAHLRRRAPPRGRRAAGAAAAAPEGRGAAAGGAGRRDGRSARRGAARPLPRLLRPPRLRLRPPSRAAPRRRGRPVAAGSGRPRLRPR